jgi:branched-chain amino acid transport system ATP-binding protein
VSSATVCFVRCALREKEVELATTLKTISGVNELLKSVRGEITFVGDRIGRLPAHRVARLGIVQVPEGRCVFLEPTVEENLLLGAYLRRDRNVSADLDAVYERFPVLGTRRNQPAGLLSGGEQQMLAFGRALIVRPRLLLLDELSLGLAPIIIDEVLDVLRGLAASRPSMSPSCWWNSWRRVRSRSRIVPTSSKRTGS